MTIDCIPFKSTQPPPKPFRIVKAAVRHGDDVYTGWRHSDIIKHIHALDQGYTTQESQGFVDQHGNWYSRYQSARIALRARQIDEKTCRKSVLTSEDLWAKDGTPRIVGEPHDPCS